MAWYDFSPLKTEYVTLTFSTAIWLFHITIMVFGIETAIRSLWRKPFRPRGTWGVYLAIVFIIVVTTMLWLSSFLIPTSDTCIGDLVWWTQHYAFITVVLAPVIILINTVSSATVVAQLLRSTQVAMNERIMATRYVFTSGLSTFILVSPINFTSRRMSFAD